MPNFKHIIAHVKNYGIKHKPLYILAFMLFFWVLFDGILEYILPVLIVENGFTKTMMGIIIGTSSIAGLVFDLFICKYLRNTNFRRIYLMMFIVGAIYPLMLWKTKIFWVYVLAMAIWGLYYDFYNFGNYDFIGRHTKKSEHSSSFGVLKVFGGLGYMLAPLIAGFLIGERVGFKPFAMSWIFLGISFIFFLILIFFTKKIETQEEKAEKKPMSFFREFSLLGEVGKLIYPVLIVTFTICLIDATFWTVGPLLAESLGDMSSLAGMFLSAFLLPTLIVGWFVGDITVWLGKKRTAIAALFFGSLIISSFVFIHNPIVLVGATFFAAIFIAFIGPSIDGAYADYISESPKVEKEIEGLTDSLTNLGYIVGPIFAGILADHVGDYATFTVVGAFGAVTAIILFFITPKHIKVVVKNN